MDEILNSPLVCDPIRRPEICAPNDGAAAVVIASARKVAELGLKSQSLKVAACAHTIARYSSDFRCPADSMSAQIENAGGRIIVTGSVIGDRPRAGLAAYAASRSGAHALTEALALELGPRDITVNAVALGWFDTGLGAHWHRDERGGNDIVDHTSLGRWGTADDLPGAYLFLASASSAYVTGSTLTVDGGYSLK